VLNPSYPTIRKTIDERLGRLGAVWQYFDLVIVVVLTAFMVWMCVYVSG
jgi:hypothetical protein